MGISSITRDWGIVPNMVRIQTSDSLGVVSAANYILSQQANIVAANNGLFEWVASDQVLVNAADGNGFFMISSNFNSLIPSPSLSPVQSGITALAGGGQTGAPLLTPGFNVISVVATTGDSVDLPVDVLGQTVIVHNSGANSANVFPSLDGNINALSANAALAVAAAATTIFYGVSATNWQSK